MDGVREGVIKANVALVGRVRRGMPAPGVQRAGR